MKKIYIQKRVASSSPPGRPRYLNLEPDVAMLLDKIALESGQPKFWLANHLLREALKNVKVVKN